MPLNIILYDQNNLDSVPKKNALAYISPSGKSVRDNNLKVKKTYLAFLDLKKAYDSVPIYNILTKIENIGIRGKCYNFIKNLYLSSKANVRLNMKCSNTFNVQRGVRQGCPFSPILFNLFINDIFQGCKKYGVKCGESYCCGGLFADDIVLCAPTKKKLSKLLKKV